MDWSSDEGRALLWKAYPAVLRAPGLHTLGGLTCVFGSADPRGVTIYVSYDVENVANDRLDRLGSATGEIIVGRRNRVIGSHPLSMAEAAQCIAAGDLLPNPDPNDPATWACLLADLWGACPNYVKGLLVTGYGWHRYRSTWFVTAYLQGGRALGWEFRIDTDDSAEALIRARIALRDGERVEV